MGGVTFNVTIDGKAAELTVEKTSGALAMIFGPAAHELGMAWGERAAFYRFRQSLRIREKTLALQVNHPIAIEDEREVTEGEGIRALEAASIEEDEAVQDMWAGLLRNARDAQTKVTIEKAFVDLLKSLSGPEAVFLNALASANEKLHALDDERRLKVKDFIARTKEIAKMPEAERPPLPEDPILQPKPSYEDIVNAVSPCFSEQWRIYDHDLRAFSIQNLVRMRLISPIFPIANQYRHGEIQVDEGYTQRKLQFVTPQEFNAFAKSMKAQIAVLSGSAEAAVKIPPPDLSNIMRKGFAEYLPEMHFKFLPLGIRLMESCSVPKRNESAFTPVFKA